MGRVQIVPAIESIAVRIPPFLYRLRTAYAANEFKRFRRDDIDVQISNTSSVGLYRGHFAAVSDMLSFPHERDQPGWRL